MANAGHFDITTRGFSLAIELFSVKKKYQWYFLKKKIILNQFSFFSQRINYLNFSDRPRRYF